MKDDRFDFFPKPQQTPSEKTILEKLRLGIPPGSLGGVIVDAHGARGGNRRQERGFP